MTQAFLHSLNIGTLSTWLSLAGFGTVGVVVLPWEAPPANPAVTEETEIVFNDFDLGAPLDTSAADGMETPAAGEAPAAPAETLPAPPELAPLAESGPLPEIPDLPAPSAAPRGAEAPRESRPAENSAVSGPRAPASTSPRRPATASGRPAGGGGTSAAGTGSGMSNAARLAAGRMPSPAYPAAARRGGQTGTVVVEFTVDTTGRVIAAHAAKPSPWPLLNNEAVRTVRRWKFPPGGVMKLQRPITFQLR